MGIWLDQKEKVPLLSQRGRRMSVFFSHTRRSRLCLIVAISTGSAKGRGCPNRTRTINSTSACDTSNKSLPLHNRAPNMHGVALATPTKALVSGHLSHRPLRHRGTARLVRDKPRNVGLFRRFKPPSAVGTGEQESQTETHDEESKETISSNVSNVVAKPRDFFADNYGHVMLQGFHWTSCNYDLKHGRSWYGELRDHVSDIQATGATVMWLPPPSHSVSPEGYLPQCLYGEAPSSFCANYADQRPV